MELSNIEQLNLHAGGAEIEDWIGQFELWYNIRRDVNNKDQTEFCSKGFV